MYETYTTVIGTVVSEPRHRQTATGEPVISFRVACNSRRIDKRTQEWIDGPTLYLTVSCWRRLLTGVSQAVAKGRPVIAHGQIKTNEYVTADGERRADLEMTATAVGLDLSRCVVSFEDAPGRGPSAADTATRPDVSASDGERCDVEPRRAA